MVFEFEGAHTALAMDGPRISQLDRELQSCYTIELKKKLDYHLLDI